jgi:hypothetical protein
MIASNFFYTVIKNGLGALAKKKLTETWVLMGLIYKKGQQSLLLVSSW